MTIEEQPTPTCKHCWIPAVEPVEAIREVGKTSGEHYFIHKAVRDAVGNQYCGRARLFEDDVEYTTSASE